MSRGLRFVSCLASVFLPLALAPAQGMDASNSPEVAQSMTRDDIAAIADRVVPQALREQHVSGAIISVVASCETVFARGYGEADRAAHRPMDPQQTFFRIGSISKVITATVAMVLAQRGMLDLDADIREYLPPDLLRTAFDDPISMQDLLAHTAGFGEVWTGLGTDRIAKIVPFADFLAELPPPQLRPPRTVKIYNSTAFAIAALVMERITGKSFEQLTHELLFVPAGMATQTQVLTAAQIPQLATGYSFDGTDFRPQPRDIYLHIAPGGDGVATAVDLTQFVKLHLGCPAAAPALSAESLSRMHRTYFTHDPAVAGMALGFEEFRWKGRTWLKKAGGAPGMTTFIAFLPGSGFGFFIGVNTDQSPLWRSVMQPFADKLALYPEHRAIAPDAPIGDVRKYAGWYRPLRYSPHNYEKILSLRHVQVTANDSKGLHYRGQDFRPVSATLFQSRDNRQILGFRLRPDGRPDFLFLDGSDGYEALSGWESLPVQVGLSAMFALLFGIGASYTLVRACQRRAAQGAIGQGGAIGVLALAGTVALLNVLFLAGMAASLATLDIWTLQLGMPPSIRLALILPMASIIALALLSWCALRSRGGELSARERVVVWTIALAALLFIPYLMYWNLLGYVV